jgi:hypothetical protein
VPTAPGFLGFGFLTRLEFLRSTTGAIRTATRSFEGL